MNKKTIRDVDLTGKRVLVRADFNVPLAPQKGSKDGSQSITDDTRIRESIPTLQYILEQKPKAVIIMTHLGRPKGRVEPEFSVKPIVPVLSQYLGREVVLSGDCRGKFAQQIIEDLPDGGVVLLQNTRFYAEEEENDPTMAQELASLGDIFVNDAFGAAHRAHASTVGITQYLESVAGFLLEKEIDFLVNAIENPTRPFIAIMGGGKISDKVKVIESLLGKVDKLLIGGAMGTTFWAAQGIDVADSKIDTEALPLAKDLLKEHGAKIVLPVDAVIAQELVKNPPTKTVKAERVPAGWKVFDVGAETIKQFSAILQTAKTIIWNGPLGVFEVDPFANGTLAVAEELADLTTKGVITIIGGGDSAAAVMQAGLSGKMTHISTGGGASLELLEGRELPGLAALTDK